MFLLISAGKEGITVIRELAPFLMNLAPILPREIWDSL
jgi:hypothetical protein